MNIITGGVTSPKGFKAAGIYAGIKKKEKIWLWFILLFLLRSRNFTTNIVKAAPVLWDIKLTKESENIQALVINSGVANACTGKEGEK